MATEEELVAGLRKADAAGNTADAKAFADALRSMRASSAPQAPQQGMVSRFLTQTLAGGDRPPEPAAETLGGALEQGVKQFGYGASRMSGLGTVARAVGRTAGLTQTTTQPGTVPEYIGRGLGNLAGLAMDAIAIPEILGGVGLANAVRGSPALTEGAQTGVNTVLQTGKNIAEGVGTGATGGAALGGLESYAATGKVDPKAMVAGGLFGSAVGAAVPALSAAGEAVSRLSPQTAAAIRAGSEKGTLETAAPLQDFTNIATETNPAMRAELPTATRGVEGQQRLATAVGGELQRTGEALQAPTGADVTAMAANVPVRAEIKKGVSQQQQDIAATQQQAKAAETGAKTAEGQLGDANKLPSDLGRELQVASRNKVDELKAARDQEVAPQREALDAAAAQNGGEVPKETTDPVLKALDLAKLSSGQSVADTIAAPEIVEAAGSLPTKAQVREGNSLRALVFPDESNTTNYRRLKLAEQELESARGRATNGSDYNAYSTALNAVRTSLNDFTGGAEQAFRDAYRTASEPLNQLTQGEGKFVPDAMELRKYETASTPAEQAEFNQRASATIDKAIKGKEVGAQNLIDVLGPDKAQEIAGHYLARQLKGKSAEQVQDFVFKNADFLSRFPENGTLRKGLDNLANARQAEAAAGTAAKEAGKVKVEPPTELTKQLFSTDPATAQQQVDKILDAAGTKAAPVQDLRRRLVSSLGEKKANEEMVNAVKRRISRAVSEGVDQLGKGTAKLGEASGVVNDISRTWETLRKGLLDSGTLPKADVENIDKVLSGIRAVRDTPTPEMARALEVALSPTGRTVEDLPIKGYTATGMDVAGSALKTYLNPMKLFGYEKRVQKFLDDAMFDRQVMSKLAKRLDAAKSKSAKARVLDANAVTRGLLMAHYVAQGQQKAQPDEAQP